MVALFSLVLSLSACSSAQSDEPYSPYDEWFRLSAQKYMPAYDWRWLVAQCRQESGPEFSPYALSSAGALGTCQMTKDTWFDMQLRMGFVANRTSARHNIMAAGFYMKWLIRQWSGRGRDRNGMLVLGQSAYNCGMGCVLAAQAKADDARDFPDIAPFLPRETREYPHHVRRHFLRYTRDD